MKRSSLIAVILVGSFSLLVAGWTNPYVRPSSGIREDVLIVTRPHLA